MASSEPGRLHRGEAARVEPGADAAAEPAGVAVTAASVRARVPPPPPPPAVPPRPPTSWLRARS